MRPYCSHVTEPREAGPNRSAAWVAVLGGLAGLLLVATLPLTLLSGQLGDGLVALVIGIPCASVTVAAFAARLQDEVDLDSVRADLAGVVTSTLEPAHLSVWLGERD